MCGQYNYIHVVFNNGYINNSLYLAWKYMIVLQMYVWMFCQWTSSVPRGKQFSKSVQLKENSELWGADNVQGLSKHIFSPNVMKATVLK